MNTKEIMLMLEMWLMGGFTIMMMMACISFYMGRSRMHRRTSITFFVWTIACLLSFGMRIPQLAAIYWFKMLNEVFDCMCIQTTLFLMIAITGYKRLSWWIILRNYIPHIIIYILLIITHQQWPMFILGIYSAIYIVTVIIRYTQLLSIYKMYIRDEFSNIEGKRLQWMYRTLYGFPIIAVTWVGTMVLPKEIGENLYFAYAIIIWGYTIHNLTLQQQAWFPSYKNWKYVQIKYDPVPKEQVDQLYPFADSLTQVVMNPNFFLDRNVSLRDLCNELNAKPTDVTTYIRRQLGITFYIIINQQRLRFAANLLKTTTLSIEEIAQESGFNDVKVLRKLYKEESGEEIKASQSMGKDEK